MVGRQSLYHDAIVERISDEMPEPWVHVTERTCFECRCCFLNREVIGEDLLKSLVEASKVPRLCAGKQFL